MEWKKTKTKYITVNVKVQHYKCPVLAKKSLVYTLWYNSTLTYAWKCRILWQTRDFHDPFPILSTVAILCLVLQFSLCGSVEYSDKLGIFTTFSPCFPLLILYLVLHFYDFSQRGLFFLVYDVIDFYSLPMTLLITCKPGAESFWQVRANTVDSLRGRRVIISSVQSWATCLITFLTPTSGLKAESSLIVSMWSAANRPTAWFTMSVQTVRRRWRLNCTWTSSVKINTKQLLQVKVPTLPLVLPEEKQLGVFFREVLSVEGDKVHLLKTTGAGFVRSDKW